MTIINPKSIAGVTSITTPSGSDNLFTVHTNNTTERVRINNDGDVIVGSGITVSPDGDIFATGVTTSTTFVGALTGNVTGTASGNAVLTGSTNNTLVTVTGANAITGESDLTFDGTNLDLGADNKKLRVGGGNDIELYTDGSHSYLNNENGNWYIHGSTGSNSQEILIRPKQGEQSIRAIADGAVELYHDNSKRFDTTSAGIEVTGRIALMDSSDSSGSGNALWIGSGNDLKIFHDGSHSYISEQGTGNLRVLTNTFTVNNAGNSENMINATADGAVELFHNGSSRAFTTSTGLKIKTTDTDVAKIEFQTGDHDYSLVGYTGLNRFGIDTHDGLEVRDASASYATRMKIDANGRFNVNAGGSLALQTNHHCIQNSNASSWSMQAVNTASLGYGVEIRINSDTASREALYIYSTSASAAKASILSNGTFNSATNTYGSLSDVKLKENIVDANSQWDDLKAVKVRNFNFISDASNTKLIGVVAQELETVCPSLIENISDKEINGEGERVETGTSTKNVKYSVLYMKAIKTLQEAQTRIEVLETRLNNAGIAT